MSRAANVWGKGSGRYWLPEQNVKSKSEMDGKYSLQKPEEICIASIKAD